MKKNHRLNPILVVALTLGIGFAISVVSAAPPITVTSALPAEAQQGTTNLTVIINGRGFDNNMDIKFCRSETNVTCELGGVDVQPGSVKFISSKKLEVTVDVGLAAVIGNFDIEATSLRSGGRGRGTEKFAVLKAGGGDPSEGGKAFLFQIAATETCEPVIDTGAASSGHVSWSGNVLWDPENIHVHFKLQLKDVDPGTYDILGNNDGAGLGRACGTGTPDFPLCEGGVCDLKITVKQKGQGRTSGVLRLPGCDPGETTTVWATVTVTVNGFTKILRSTPITIVLPPNEVGTGQSCIE